MKISVIIPTYKPQNYLYECLNSIYDQTLARCEYEVIIVLNGCNFPFTSQIKEWMQKHPALNAIFIQTDEVGVSNARNVALRVTQGEYIAFIDDDDIVSPCYLQELLLVAKPSILSVSYTQAFVGDDISNLTENGKMSSVFKPNGNVSLNQGRSFMSGPCMKLIHRNIIGNSLFNVNFKNGEDTLFMFEISRKIESIAFTGVDAIYFRRIREGSATMSQKANWNSRWLNMKEALEYIKMYIRHPFSYNINLFLSRVGGSLYAFIFMRQIIRRRKINSATNFTS